MKNIRISAKLGLAFGVITLLTILLSFTAWRQMLAMNSSTEDIATNWLPSVQTLGEMRIAANRVRRSESVVFLPDASVADDRYRKELQERVAGLENSQLAYEPLVTPGEEQRLFNQFKAQKQKYLQIQKSMLGLPSDSFVATRGQFLGDSEQAFDEMANTLGELAALNRRHSDMAQKDAEHVFSQAETTLLAISLAVVGIAIGLAFWISKIITRPLRQAVEIAEGVSAGNLAMEITADGSDEPAQLMKALAHMRTSLASVVSDVRDNAEGVATASAEIAQGNNDLSSRTEQQASALEETAASMEELSSTVRNNADSAQRANELAGTASQVAKRSGETVEAMVATMKTIAEASKSIGEIISVIDSIAFQTNILALNAAVEAARAGEQGRGFAVVATEVRSLAKRSADAAKQIKDLIATSEARVADGSAQADRAGLSMREVVTSIESVAAIVGEISIATREQSAGISQVGEAVTQMDQVTQQNAALVEQSAAAASSLSEQAERLVASVAVFRVSGMVDNEAVGAQAARDIIARVSGQPYKQLLAGRSQGASATPG